MDSTCSEFSDCILHSCNENLSSCPGFKQKKNKANRQTNKQTNKHKTKAKQKKQFPAVPNPNAIKVRMYKKLDTCHISSGSGPVDNGLPGGPVPPFICLFSSFLSVSWGPFSSGAPGHCPPMPPTRYATAYIPKS